MIYNIIVAHTFKKNGIGIKNQLPWKLKNEMSHFREKTTAVIDDKVVNYINSVIMGKKTWDSIPESNKPLKNRLNVIITTKDIKSHNKFVVYCKWDEIVQTIIKFNNELHTLADNTIIQIYHNYIIGGEQIYNLALKKLDIHKIYTTEIYKDAECDKFFPNIQEGDYKNFVIQECSDFIKENGTYYRFVEYINQKSANFKPTTIWKNKEELKYLEVMTDILENGIERSDRTGIGTISQFGITLKYDLKSTFPVSTTKKIFVRAVFEELMMYLRGQTDNKILNDKKIHIWDGNTSREFLNKRGLTEYAEGDMGETYGFNFRHFGGDYQGCKSQHNSKNGFDQLKYVINTIKNDPTSRRIIINLWNPKTTHKAALPSCLCMYQFYVDTVHNLLHLQIYIRSSDYFLANNWNTCTGAFFVHMICSLIGIDLSPGTLTVVCGDAHIYKTHVSQVRENLKRKPFPYPKLVVSGRKQNICDFKWEDFQLLGYKSHPNISAPMAV
jgi:dihydrofolate reductase / thymidylate synthase